jgi:hypothetical protein
VAEFRAQYPRPVANLAVDTNPGRAPRPQLAEAPEQEVLTKQPRETEAPHPQLAETLELEALERRRARPRISVAEFRAQYPRPVANPAVDTDPGGAPRPQLAKAPELEVLTKQPRETEAPHPQLAETLELEALERSRRASVAEIGALRLQLEALARQQQATAAEADAPRGQPASEGPSIPRDSTTAGATATRYPRLVAKSPSATAATTPSWASSIMMKLASLPGNIAGGWTTTRRRLAKALHYTAKAIDADYRAATAAAAKAATAVNTAATDRAAPPREAGLESSPLRPPWSVDRRTWLGSAAGSAALVLLCLLLPEGGIQQRQRGCTPPPATTCRAGSPSATTLLPDESATALQRTEALKARLTELRALVATRQGSSTLA